MSSMTTTSSSAVQGSPIVRLPVLLRQVGVLALLAGFIEVTGYLDLSSIYPGIMTGNNIQLGASLAQHLWSNAQLIFVTVGSFFIGSLVASVIRRRVHRVPIEFSLMAVLLVVAGFVRHHAGWRYELELPLLAFVLGLQGQAMLRFGGSAVQTTVTTGNMMKCADAIVGRFITNRRDKERPARSEILFPGTVWLSCIAGGALGVFCCNAMRYPLLVPAALLLVLSIDLVLRGDGAVAGPKDLSPNTPLE